MHTSAEYQCYIFILPCLQNLKELELLIRPDLPQNETSGTYVGICMDVLEALAGTLSGLEKFSMSAGLDIGRIEPIHKLTMLKDLKWSVVYGALRGVEIGSDLTRCIPMFEEFVENASVSVDFEPQSQWLIV